MKIRTFKELHADMRDERNIYPRRGSSLEEVCVLNLMDVIHYFDSIKFNISINLRDEQAKDSFKYFEKIMHEKFDTIESMLKTCNIEQWEVYEELKKKELNENKN